MGIDGPPVCPICDGTRDIRPVPAGCRKLLSSDPATIHVCRSCLSIEPAPGQAVDRQWEPADVANSLPANPDAAVAVAILVALLDSLALNRREIVAVVEYLEREGVDPLLAVDRIAGDPSISSHVDLRRRRDQLAQILDR